MKRFNSRSGWEIWMIVVGLILLSSYPSVREGNIWIVLLPLVVVVFAFLVVTNTTYTVSDEGKLFVRHWFMAKFGVDIREITQIRETKSLQTAPAPSFLGRIEIVQKNGDTLILLRSKKAISLQA